LVRSLIPDVPFDVEIFQERQTVFNEKLIDLGPDENFEEAKELYERLSKVRKIVGPIRASVLTDEELKKYMPTEESQTEKIRHENVNLLFKEATERLISNAAASETRDSEVRQSTAEIELVSDKAVPKNPRASADLRLTSAIDEMTRYSESGPPPPSSNSPRFEANEEPIQEDDEGDNQDNYQQNDEDDNQDNYHQNDEEYGETEEEGA